MEEGKQRKLDHLIANILIYTDYLKNGFLATSENEQK